MTFSWLDRRPRLVWPCQSFAYWYDSAQFHDLLYGAGARPVRELIARLDGCTGAKAGEIVS
jgi:hypothetical protein